MGNCDMVMLAFRPILGEVSGKNRYPAPDILGCIVKSAAQVSGAKLFHICAAILSCPDEYAEGDIPGAGQLLVRRIKV